MARHIDVEGYRKLFDEEYKKTRKLISEGETHLDNLAEGFSEASRVIDRIPTADVVSLPCKIGDTVWAIRNYHSTKKVMSGKVSEMFFMGEEMRLCIVVKNISRGEWGKDVFGSYEDAEKRLHYGSRQID